MLDHQRYTLFSGACRLACGDLQTIAVAAREALTEGLTEGANLFVFSDHTGRLADLDLRGSSADVAARYADTGNVPPKAARGRPKLGVVAREVTLLPRHWEWLGSQPGGASAALRRLVDQARRENAGPDRRREAREAAHRVMTALAGDLANYEDALRAFYAGEKDRFYELLRSWPAGIGDYVRSHAEAAWEDSEVA
jgi:hypothetical protein